MRRIRIFLLILATAVLAACNGFERPFEGTYDQVLIYYGMGYNNLSANLRQNLQDLQRDVLPGLWQDRAIIAFSHNVAVPGDYTTPNPPVLMRIYRGSDGKPVCDTLKTYSDMAVSASPESLRRVLNDVRDAYPARRYGMVLSSHGTGWLPPGYNDQSKPRSLRGKPEMPDQVGHDGAGLYGPEGLWPATKAIGNQYSGSVVNAHWIEVPELASAFPFHLEYLIIDACLSGCVEIAWELRDVADRLVVSPCEILTFGMGYSILSWDMFAYENPNLERYCREYYEYYNGQEGSYQSGTISLVETAQLDALAEAFRDIVDAHREAIDISLSATVQRYYYGSSHLSFFYDLRDLAAAVGATPSELDRLDAALAAAVPCHYETETFFDLPLERCCGLSVYLPDPTRPTLNAYYRELSWNQRVGLVE